MLIRRHSVKCEAHAVAHCRVSVALADTGRAARAIARGDGWRRVTLSLVSPEGPAVRIDACPPCFAHITANPRSKS